MDDKNFHESFGFLNESFITNKIEELEKLFQQLHLRKTQVCSVFNLKTVLVFDYGCTINVLLTNWFGPYEKIFVS